MAYDAEWPQSYYLRGMVIRQRVIFFVLLTTFHVNAFAQYSIADWEDRDGWMHVVKLFELVGIAMGDKVADVGCHEGYLSFHLSEQVGERGKVYAVDVMPSRLDKLKAHIEERQVINIEPILGGYEDPKLPANTLDAILVVDTYHEMEAYATILEHLKKALKNNGRLLILEKLKAHMKGKTREEQSDAHTLSLKYVKKELKEAGFNIVEEISDFGTWNHEAHKQMWVLVAVPVKTSP